MNLFPWRNKESSTFPKSKASKSGYKALEESVKKDETLREKYLRMRKLAKQYKVFAEELVTQERKHARTAELEKRRADKLEKDLEKLNKHYLALKEDWSSVMAQLKDMAEVEEHTNLLNEQMSAIIADARAKLGAAHNSILESKQSIDKFLDSFESLHDILHKDIE